MSKCKSCGFDMREEDSFCNECGYVAASQEINTDLKNDVSRSKKRKIIIISSIVFGIMMLIISAIFILNRSKLYKYASTSDKLYSGGGVILLEIQDDTISEDSFSQTVKFLRYKIEKAEIKTYKISRYDFNKIKIDYKSSSEKDKLLNAIYVKELKFTGPDNVIILTNKDIHSAKDSKSLMGQPVLTINLNNEAVGKFEKATEKYKDQIIFVFVDNKLVTTFTVRGAIHSTKLSLSGGELNAERAKEYAKDINDYANIPLKFKVITQQ